MDNDIEWYFRNRKSWFQDMVEKYDKENAGKDDYASLWGNISIGSYKKAYKRYFFIDYENVNYSGLLGIENLSEDDCVHIYYSLSANKLTFGLHKKIMSSKAHFDYSEVHISIKNAMDCKILFDVEELAGANKNAEYFIVSMDSDFDKGIKDIISVEYAKIKKISAVYEYNKQNMETAEDKIRLFCEQLLKNTMFEKKKREIVNVLLNAKTKVEVNNKLMKFYSGKNVGLLYRELKPIIKDLPGQ